MSDARRGVALLEALVALALLGSVGSAAAWSAAESLRAVRRTHQREGEQRAAAQLLSAVSLWPRADLDRHLGRRAEGPWRMYIERPAPTIYTVTLTDTTGGVTVLQTAFYRAELDR